MNEGRKEEKKNMLILLHKICVSGCDPKTHKQQAALDN